MVGPRGVEIAEAPADELREPSVQAGSRPPCAGSPTNTERGLNSGAGRRVHVGQRRPHGRAGECDAAGERVAVIDDKVERRRD